MADDARLDRTSLNLRGARDGDAAALQALVERVSPLLLAQARYRLRGALRSAAEPEDLVQETWAVVLPRLGELQARDGRLTPVLMRFVSTTLVQLINNLSRQHIRRRGELADAPLPATAGPGVVTQVAHTEAFDRVVAVLDELDAQLREILVLRVIEQRDNAEAADLLGITPNAASLRLRRARDAVRARLGESVLDDL